MKVKMIGNKNKKGAMGILLLIILMLVLIFAAFWILEEVTYSLKNKQVIDEHDATCYFERGLFKFPLARICSYNDTIIVEKTRFGKNLVERVKQFPQEFR